MFIIEALCRVGRPLSATELRALCGEAADLDAISFHLHQLAKLRIVKKVAKLKVRKSQGPQQESFFVLATDSGWVDRLDPADSGDPLATVASEATVLSASRLA